MHALKAALRKPHATDDAKRSCGLCNPRAAKPMLALFFPAFRSVWIRYILGPFNRQGQV
jgi:hypothetical protein